VTGVVNDARKAEGGRMKDEGWGMKRAVFSFHPSVAAANALDGYAAD
jgi:hypothetical protein